MRSRLPHPQLWWPNGYGKQHRYELDITAQDARAARNCTPCERRSASVTCKCSPIPSPTTPVSRLLGLGPEPRGHFPPTEGGVAGAQVFDADQQPADLCHGSNWIPTDFLYGRPRRQRYEYLVRSAAEANCNLFRVWGGGVLEKAEFRELCDQYGIMLFHEFWQGRPHETDAALAISARETREVLPLLANHPSVVRYTGGNEMYLNAKNSRQMAELRAICNQFDPTRPFHDPDPETMFQRHGEYWYDDPGFYAKYRAPCIGGSGPANPMEWNEFGVAGAASVESLKAMMPAGDLWPVHAKNPSWMWHKGIDGYGPDNWLGMPGFTELFGPSPDLPTLVRRSQFVQAEGFALCMPVDAAIPLASQHLRHLGLQRALAECGPRRDRGILRSKADGLLLREAGVRRGRCVGRLCQSRSHGGQPVGG